MSFTPSVWSCTEVDLQKPLRFRVRDEGRKTFLYIIKLFQGNCRITNIYEISNSS